MCPADGLLVSTTLPITISDERSNAWALEMLGRRHAVARWRRSLTVLFAK